MDRLGGRRRVVGEKGRKPQEIALFVSVGVAGAISGAAVGFAAAADLPPVLTGLLAGFLSALSGAATFIAALRLVGE
jgi:hypothetical protein